MLRKKTAQYHLYFALEIREEVIIFQMFNKKNSNHEI